DPSRQQARGNVTVSFDVQNTGARAGDEVVQLYTHELVTSVTAYEKNLRGFERIHLRPSDTKTVTFTLTSNNLALWDRNMHFVVEQGTFRVMIGASSEDIRLTGEFAILPDTRPRYIKPERRLQLIQSTSFRKLRNFLM